MQTSQEPRRDDFDMAKLQKSLTQQQHRSIRLRHTVSKLTPAEIRSLNNSVDQSKANNRSSSTSSRKASTNTPPATPDHIISNQLQTSNRNSVSLPTPPQSPDNAKPQRQNSASRNGMHIHSPIPQSHSKAGFVLATGGSRPSSASSYRGMPTYRGPEVTKNGSFSIFQTSQLSHQIVDNPLSQFSRPRQSRGSVSPTRQEQKDRTPSRQSDTRSHRSQSLPVTTSPTTRSISPPAIVESPVSAEEDIVVAPAVATSTDQGEQTIQRSQTVAVDESVSKESQSRFSWSWRRSLGTHRAEGSGDVQGEKTRRRATTWTKGTTREVPSVAYENTRSGIPPKNRDSLKGDLPSSRTSIYSENHDDSSANKTSFEAHPAVRPLSAQSGSSQESKTKSREDDHDQEALHDVLSDDTIPMYSRCSCCGKLKKPSINRSLSPVLENENLRTNFSLEVERTENLSNRRRGSSSASRSKYTAIIPMMIADGQTVQAKIAPPDHGMVPRQPDPAPVINERGDVIASGTAPIALIPKALEERDRKLTRFQSLHLSEELLKHPKSKGKAVSTSNGQAMLLGKNNGPNRMINGGMSLYAEAPRSSVQQAQDSGVQAPTLQETGVVVPEGTEDVEPLEATGELMAALNGVDLSTDLDSGTAALQVDQGTKIEPINCNGYLKGQLEDSSSASKRDTVLSAPSTIGGDVAGINIPDRTKSPKVVSFDTPPVQQQPRSSTGNALVSIYKRVSLDRNAAAASNKLATTYMPSSSHGFTTRPKSTAQYLMGTQDAGPKHKHTDNAQSEGRSTAEETDEQADEEVALVPTVEAEEPEGDNHDKLNGKDDATSLHENRVSATYDSLPVPNLGFDFGVTNATWNDYILPYRKPQSNLVESVLAATNGQYDMKDDREKDDDREHNKWIDRH